MSLTERAKRRRNECVEEEGALFCEIDEGKRCAEDEGREREEGESRGGAACAGDEGTRKGNSEVFGLLSRRPKTSIFMKN